MVAGRRTTAGGVSGDDADGRFAGFHFDGVVGMERVLIGRALAAFGAAAAEAVPEARALPFLPEELYFRAVVGLVLEEARPDMSPMAPSQKAERRKEQGPDENRQEEQLICFQEGEGI